MATPMSTMTANHQLVQDFYLRGSDADGSIFEVWERGEARGDSITPSTYCAAYRSWMRFCLSSLLGRPGGRRLISIGCGNAAIEAELSRLGHPVLAVDILRDAVELAQRKGVAAIQADVTSWRPPAGEAMVVYADGLVGHLYDPERHALPTLDHVRSWLADSPDSVLVISNDEAQDGEDVQAASGVPGFHWYSESYLFQQLRVAGFTDVFSTRYTYERPLSGTRDRIVVVARP